MTVQKEEPGTQDSDAKSLLNKINTAYRSNSKELYELLIYACDKSELTSKIPCIYVNWFSRRDEHPLDYGLTVNRKLFDNLLSGVESALSDELRTIHIPEDEAVRLKDLFRVVETCQNHSYTVMAAIRPTEWHHCFFVYKDFDEIIPWLLLHQFEDSYKSGGADIESFEKDGIDCDNLKNNFEQWLNDEYGSLNQFYKDNKFLKYKISDELVLDFFGNKKGVQKKLYTNLEILNLDEQKYTIFTKAIALARKYYMKSE